MGFNESADNAIMWSFEIDNVKRAKKNNGEDSIFNVKKTKSIVIDIWGAKLSLKYFMIFGGNAIFYSILLPNLLDSILYFIPCEFFSLVLFIIILFVLRNFTCDVTIPSSIENWNEWNKTTDGRYTIDAPQCH